ncbi:MAG: DNA polymerase I [Rikenellaceae bacterium]|jgi:DNA polymerase-1|nr:DNA polymerase I [Rikenellaceae bacterium]
MEKLFLIDAYALIYRNYYAFLGRPMRNAQGMNTSAVFGFVKFLKELIAREHPQYIGVAFDLKGGSFRRELYPQYKANRQETPDDITLSVPYIKQALEAMRIPILEAAGFEADDVIGTLAKRASSAGYQVFMVTPDKDFGQLVEERIAMYKPTKDGFEICGPREIREQYGIADPVHVIDILTLWGDASDNIPGVAGIGEKGASKLVGEWGTVENLLENLDKIKGKQRENLDASREQIALSKTLATIRTDAPIEFDPEKLRMEEPDREALIKVYKELGFTSLIRALETGGAAAGMGGGFGETSSGPSKTAQNPQPDLFSAAAVAQPDLFDQPAQYATAATTDHKYHLVRTEAEVAALVARLKTYSEFCFDAETTGLDPLTSRIIGLSLAVEPHEAYYIPLERDDPKLNLLRPLFEDDTTAKIGQNTKFDIMMLAASNIRVRGFRYDTMILHYLLDADSRHNMNHLARVLLGYDPISIETLIGRGARQITMDMVPPERVAEYAAEDADITLQLKQLLWPQIVGQGLDELYRRIEEPLVDTLAEIEMAGVKIDTQFLADYAVTLNGKLAELETQIRALADEPTLNINSARQLGQTLFLKMKIAPNPGKTRSGQFSTDEETLQSLADRHPIVGLVLEYRGVKKLLSTYVEALPQLVNPRTGRVHTSFNQAVTVTGRLSSTNPNLQNIPIRDEMGREIRKAFIPCDNDHILLSADYSQVELRLMAHLSGDRGLIEAFERGEDVHAATAAKIYDVPLSEVTSEQRRRAKTANFGIIYGISPFGLSQRLNIPRAEAKALIDGYFASYPGVKQYMENTILKAREQGYVTTIFGRKRHLPDIRSSNANVRGLAERNAINTPLQGSAADIMKLAMTEVMRRFRVEGVRSQVILQVHDELVVDTLRSERQQVEKILKEAMEEAADLSVKLTVEVGAGESWFDAH